MTMAPNMAEDKKQLRIGNLDDTDPHVSLAIFASNELTTFSHTSVKTHQHNITNGFVFEKYQTAEDELRSML
jgi:hypothetical protein